MTTTIDNYLLSIAECGLDQLTNVPARDIKVLNSLTRQLKSNVFLTENQANLLLKILKENSANLPDVPQQAVWSREFRQLDQVRNIKWDRSDNTITIELSFSKRIKQMLMDLKDKLDGSVSSSTSGKSFKIDLTENNLYKVLTLLQHESFVIDEELIAFYKEISEIIKTKHEIIDINNNDSIRKAVSEHIDLTDALLVADRRIRYQYKAPNVPGDSLAIKIANRKYRKIFVPSDKVNFDQLIQSLVDLDRKNILIVMNSFSSTESVAALEQINYAVGILEGPARSIGIYFRFDNQTLDNKKFNEYVKDNALNSPLTKTSFIAGIANNQIPKFIFKEGWYPDTVISFVPNLHNNKVSAFCDSVDAMIYYTKNKPIHSSGEIDDIV